VSAGPAEPLDRFRARAAAWLVDTMPPAPPGWTARAAMASDEVDRFGRQRWLQRRLHDGGFAGLSFPVAYGGHGLDPDYQRAFADEAIGYEMPIRFSMPTLGIIGATLLEFGTEEQKRRHIPPMLRGEEVWAQFLSEPGGGSDAAGAVTTATRDGEQWVLNGSKIWTTGAWYSDWAMCLARTNWEVEKHRGLTVFSLPVRSPGVEVHRIELLNGSKEFCQEFLTDVIVDDANRIGDIDGGWTVMTRWLHHERTIAGGSPYVTSAGSRGDSSPNDGRELARLARRLGAADDAPARSSGSARPRRWGSSAMP